MQYAISELAYCKNATGIIYSIKGSQIEARDARREADEEEEEKNIKNRDREKEGDETTVSNTEDGKH